MAGVLSGQWSERSWNMKYRKLRFFFGKGIVEELLAQLRIEKVRFRPVEGEGYAFLQPGRAAEVLSGGTVLGWVGEIHPEAREAMGIDEVVVAFELDLDKLIKGARNQENYREFSQYPAVEHDLAIVVDNTVTCEDLERRITSAGGKLLEGVRLFDFGLGQAEAGRLDGLAAIPSASERARSPWPLRLRIAPTTIR